MKIIKKLGYTYVSPAFYLFIISIFYFVGIIGHLFPGTYPLMLKLTPSVLLFSALSAVYPFIQDCGKKAVFWVVPVFIFTFFIEASGTATGKIFGSYIYGETLGLRILDVPPVIALNWVLVIAGLVYWIEKITGNWFFSVILTAAGAVLFDFIMEPVAVMNNYWKWDNSIIPVQNYIAWAVIAALAALLWKVLHVKKVSVFPAYLLLVQFVFFLALRISYLFL